ncbi:hypothetical protein EPUS_04817 [Endocarpon pusillum Z07020]|uniref:Uncharacterized protein n=1 Tax=Endocarpon pusillum (strain Z07020 / HMAS-L-300199) TaxID=1263415 RepID=U1HU15_ENDPU|nr:uncharacterized protein EPUS_04817 [Endocarpon pusillum Z07020]ERF72764.1 hypothetical protein EPUS_04817 [Endocarpon pusillum Z07020]
MWYPSAFSMLVAANAFSIMVAMGGQAAIDWFTTRFSQNLADLKRINAITLHLDVPLGPEMRQPLLTFTNNFLRTSSYETHKIAVALARLGCVITLSDELESLRKKPFNEPIFYGP